MKEGLGENLIWSTLKSSSFNIEKKIFNHSAKQVSNYLPARSSKFQNSQRSESSIQVFEYLAV